MSDDINGAPNTHYLQDTGFQEQLTEHPSAYNGTDVLLYDYTVSVGTVWGIFEP